MNESQNKGWFLFINKLKMLKEGLFFLKSHRKDNVLQCGGYISNFNCSLKQILDWQQLEEKRLTVAHSWRGHSPSWLGRSGGR